MKLNKINIEAYEEILKDLYLFIKINPSALQRHFDYTPLGSKEESTKYDNPTLYSDMFEYAKTQQVISVQTEEIEHINPFPDLPDRFGILGGTYTHYRVKVDKARLDEELTNIEIALDNNNQTTTVATIYLEGNELFIESEYGSLNIHKFRAGSPLRDYINYILNSKPDVLVKLTDLKKAGVEVSDTMSEMLRKSSINETIKRYFFPNSTANTVIARQKVMIKRTDWNAIVNSLSIKH